MSNVGATTPGAGDSGISQLNDAGSTLGYLDYSDNGGALGQSFTLGSGSFYLNAISLKAIGDTGGGAYTAGTWRVQVARYDNVSSGGFAERTDHNGTPYDAQYTSNTFINQVYTGIVTTGTDAVAGDWITFSFTDGDVLTLDGDHTYSFQITSSQGWAGFDVADSDVYAGGERFQSYGGGLFNDNYVNNSAADDRTFVLNLSAVPEPSAALLGGLGFLGLLRRRRA